MRPVPWSRLAGWSCMACGACCKKYRPSLTRDEALELETKFGPWVVEAGRSPRIRYGKRGCPFLVGNICTLQRLGCKPRACKLWPFKIYTHPKHGRSREALFYFVNRKFYVYISPACGGLIPGKPSVIFVAKVIPEFINLALGFVESQHWTTCFGADFPLRAAAADGSNLGAQNIRFPRTAPEMVATMNESSGRRISPSGQINRK